MCNTEMDKRVIAAGVVLLLTAHASGTDWPPPEMKDINDGLLLIAAALGAMVIAYAGIRWIMAENPQERDDSKKTIIYAIIGLLIVSMANDLVAALYQVPP